MSRDSDTNYAGAIYGTIVSMAVIATSAKDPSLGPVLIAFWAAVTALIFWLAHVYADIVAEGYARFRDAGQVGPFVRDDLRACLPSWPAERIETLYNRIDVDAVQADLLDRAAARAFLQLPQNAWVVGNVGRLHPDKDQASLIRGFARALPRLPPGSLLAIMGSGRLEPMLRGLVADLQLSGQVRFLGQV
nr:glycosyltransferase [Solirubrobacterales bacterium]